MLFLQWLYGNRKREALHEENKKGEEEDREAKDRLQMAWFIFYWGKKNPLQTENRARVQLSFACFQKSPMPSSK